MNPNSNKFTNNLHQNQYNSIHCTSHCYLFDYFYFLIENLYLPYQASFVAVCICCKQFDFYCTNPWNQPKVHDHQKIALR